MSNYSDGPGLLRLRTSDFDTTHAHVSSTFAEHELSLDPKVDLDFRLDISTSARLTAGRMAYGAAATLIGPPMQLCYHFNLAMTGQSTVEHNGVVRTFTAGSSGVAFGPSAPVLVQWSADSWQYHLKLPKDQLETHAAKLIGEPIDDEIGFDLTFDLDSGPGQALLSTTSFLFAELTRDGGIASMPAVRFEFEYALMTQLLMTVPSQLTPLLHRKSAHTGRSKIHELVQYINAHADEDIRIDDLVAMAGLSARAVQLGFQEVVGMSPTAYIRSVRLDQVHRQLSSGPAESVTDIAARWNFFHPSRFANQYRERFGVLPSVTLQRARRG